MFLGFANIPHGIGSTPTTALVSNGDTNALASAFEIYGLNGTNIEIREIGGTTSTTVRVNWIAIP